MTSYDYLIVGGGQVADDAARALREHDANGTIGIVSTDEDAPYTRPALSKKLWTDPDFSEDSVPLGTAAQTGAELRVRTRVTAIDREAKEVELESGERLGYGRLLLATGSEPRRLEGPEDERIIHFRSFADYRTLRHLMTEGARAVVVGGGYIGAEIAAALSVNGAHVTLVFPEDVLGASRFPPSIAERHQKLFTDHGVELRPGRRAERLTILDDADVGVTLDDGTALGGDIVVVGLGADPRLQLARDAGLDVADGVVVDETLRTSDPSIWAAGDIIEYPDVVLGRTRIEHVDHARESGAAAGRSMAGAEAPYDHTPYFYSMVYGVRWEAVGTLDPTLETLEVPLDTERSVVYYLDDQGRPVGVLLWQIEGARDAARTVIAEAITDRELLRGSIG
ncbi:FAD-dependent oxidoreductase [Brachybacterium vulturis]|uniref:FAD-dependent oxidoreductase n=1 Tax=Brachybacterium vulturis TaxID=2017484 RepID=A0A291GNR8_9MICO|nr:FAD-dependent oxidoreductase [Brachybacterium vulturis]ATG51999.1 FAD-dependent oxidoreductase [Brachybacterium vulturis]